MQPAYTFGVAPFFFGAASVGLAQIWAARQDHRGWSLPAIAWLATVTGGVAALADLTIGDGTAFGVFSAVSLIAVIVVLLYAGFAIRRENRVPWVLGWLIIASLPVGGALAALDERLLEVPLLIVGIGWIYLGVTMVRLAGSANR